MTTTTYRNGADSTAVKDIPTHYNNKNAVVPGYADGTYENYAEVKRLFPKAVNPSITTRSADETDADFADSEKGDFTPDQVAVWAARQKRSGARPGIYCSKSMWATIIKACEKVGVKATDVNWWIASWTGTPHHIDGACGVQYASPSLGSPGHYDLTLWNAYIPGIDPKPRAKPSPFKWVMRHAINVVIRRLNARTEHDHRVNNKGLTQLEELQEALNAYHKLPK